jgi:hypothetical protein
LQSACLGAAHADVLQMHAESLNIAEANNAIAADQNLALACERKRVVNELAALRSEMQAADQRIATSKAPIGSRSCDPTLGRPEEQIGGSPSIKTDGRLTEQLPGETAASNAQRSPVSELPHSEPQSTIREASFNPTRTTVEVTERSTLPSNGSRSPMDEKRLLARASMLLRQADVAGARLLLEYAFEQGSARTAFVLAETFDARVLQARRIRGIAGDPTKARELYEKALAGGIESANERIRTLK